MKMKKFAGTFKKLQAIVGEMGVVGTWQAAPKQENGIRFRADCGPVLNFWPSTGSINIQGIDQDAFRSRFLEARATVAEQRVALLEKRVRRLRRRLKVSEH